MGVVRQQLDVIREWLVWVLTFIVGLGISWGTTVSTDVKRIDAEQQRNVYIARHIEEMRTDLKELRVLMAHSAEVDARRDGERTQGIKHMFDQLGEVKQRIERMEVAIQQLMRGSGWKETPR